MTTIKKAGGPSPAQSTGGPDATSGVKNKTSKAAVPSAQDQATLTGKNTTANVAAASRSGALQGTRSRKDFDPTASDSDADVKDFDSISQAIGAGNEAQSPASGDTPQNGATAASGPSATQPAAPPQQTPAQSAGNEMADIVLGAAGLLNQKGAKIAPDQLAQALMQAQQSGSKDPVGDVAKALNVDPKLLAESMAQSTKMYQADQQVRQLAAALSKATGKNFTPEQVAQAYSAAAQQMQGGSGNVFQPNQVGDIHALAAKNLGVDPGDLQNAIGAISGNPGAPGSPAPAPAAGGAGGGSGAPPTPPAGGNPADFTSSGTGAMAQNMVNSDYLQNLQKMMTGLGINLPPQILQAQQGMMNQLYGYGLMQQAVQTQRAGLEQGMQIMNTVLQMNLSVMQNQTMQLNEIVAARQQMYAMNQQMVQGMFSSTMKAGQGWIKAFGGGEY